MNNSQSFSPYIEARSVQELIFSPEVSGLAKTQTFKLQKLYLNSTFKMTEIDKFLRFPLMKKKNLEKFEPVDKLTISFHFLVFRLGSISAQILLKLTL